MLQYVIKKQEKQENEHFFFLFFFTNFALKIETGFTNGTPNEIYKYLSKAKGGFNKRVE
ncbi:hypothetical protein FACS189432_05460 [Bacteroidia bacterium]|nr:hypothetical protein FACS189426_24010 [Bacteroidia bacterium]GHT28039.1 hypothetical protein FACS189432_05460 [Bacteroidia bacterium]GHV70243.1 hypothetical protein FACS189420_0540 [Bacteroidia bacterium]